MGNINANGTINVFLVLVIFVALLGGVIWLQVHLSKKENKWAGLILPILSFCLSLIIALGLTGYRINTATRMQTMDENGEVISESVIDENQMQDEDIAPDIAGIIYTFVLCNIPTVVLLAIYFSFRKKKRQQLALEKMSVQDLE